MKLIKRQIGGIFDHGSLALRRTALAARPGNGIAKYNQLAKTDTQGFYQHGNYLEKQMEAAKSTSIPPSSAEAGHTAWDHWLAQLAWTRHYQRALSPDQQQQTGPRYK
jgi:hypothetical protein